MTDKNISNDLNYLLNLIKVFKRYPGYEFKF